MDTQAARNSNYLDKGKERQGKARKGSRVIGEKTNGHNKVTKVMEIIIGYTIVLFNHGNLGANFDKYLTSKSNRFQPVPLIHQNPLLLTRGTPQQNNSLFTYGRSIIPLSLFLCTKHADSSIPPITHQTKFRLKCLKFWFQYFYIINAFIFKFRKICYI